MTPEFSFVALLDLLAFVQGTLLGILLMMKKKEHLSYFLLGMFLFSYSSELIISVMRDSNIFPQQPSLLYLPVSFYFLFMPSLFLYVKSLTQTIDWGKYKWLFLPAILEFVMMLLLFFQSADTKLEQLQSGWLQSFHIVYVYIAMIYAIVYAFFILRLIKKHRERIENFHSNMSGKLLKWVKWICIFIVIIDVMLLSSSIIPSEYFGIYIYPIVSALNVVFIFWVALSGFRQKVMEISKEEIETVKEKKKEDVLPKNENNTITKKEEVVIKDTSDEEYQKIFNFINKEKSYSKPDLHLADLARELHISQRRLSELINQKAGVNFNQFINQFRVEEAKKILVDEKFAHLNILGIAYEVGFNSKTTFYAAFKNEVGMTPSKYQKQTLLTS